MGSPPERGHEPGNRARPALPWVLISAPRSPAGTLDAMSAPDPAARTDARELVVLGTSAQLPTRLRAHSGFALRWKRDLVLFDPGEGTQRQMILAGLTAARLTAVGITHFHGDHCLGLPGVVQRRSLDPDPAPLDVYFPAEGEPYLERLLTSTVWHPRVEIRCHPAHDGDSFTLADGALLTARRLDHPTPTVGWRVEDPLRAHFDPAALDAHGVRGPAVGRLRDAGEVEVDGRLVRLDDVSVRRRGPAFALVLDTRRCGAAVDLARGVDLLACESTYAATESALAAQYGHLTAEQAAAIAAEAGAKALVLVHYSARYPDVARLRDEAAAVFADVWAAVDLDRFPVVAPSGGRDPLSGAATGP
jgi:ribonuclease Z